MKGTVFVHSINKCSCDGLFDSQLVSNFNQALEQGIPFLSHVPIVTTLAMHEDLSLDL